MRTLLVPVDGSSCSDRAVREVIAMARGSGPLEIHLINVQPRIFSEASLVYLTQDKLDSYYFNENERALASAQRLLKDAGVAFTAHRVTGPVAETIVTKARELNADAIVLGTHGHSKVIGRLLGSVCLKVLHLSDVPVTVVRAELTPDLGGRIGIA